MAARSGKRIYVVGTADTKGEELAYLTERVIEAGGTPLVIDVGTGRPPEADAALFDTLGRTFAPTAERRLIRLPYHINDPEFCAALVENFREIAA